MDKDTWIQRAEDWWPRLVDAIGLPRDVLVAALILLGGVAVAMICERITRRLAARGARLLAGWGRTRPQADTEQLQGALGRGVYWIIMVLALMAATETLGLPIVTTWISSIATYLPRIIAAIVIFALGVIGAKIAEQLVVSAARSAHIGAAERLGRITQIALLIVVGLVAIEQLGIEVSVLKTALLIVLAALLGGAALALGLGGRELVANVLSAHYVQKLYQVGQTIRLDGVEGRIVRITETALVVEVADGEVVVPAREVADGRSTLVLKGGAPR